MPHLGSRAALRHLDPCDPLAALRSGAAATGPARRTGEHVATRWRAAAQAPVGRRALAPLTARRPAWEATYSRVLLVLDVLLIGLAGALGLALRFADGSAGSLRLDGGRQVPYEVLAAGFVPAWVGLIVLCRGYEARFVGTGSDEFKRIINASFIFTALIGTTAFLLQAQLSRGFVAITMPLGVGLLLLGRYGARKVLHRLRARGRAQHRCIVIGTREEAQALTNRITSESFAGMRVVGVCLPDWETGDVLLDGVPVRDLGAARHLGDVLGRVGATTVAVAGSGALSGQELRELSWAIEGKGVDLALAPGLTDVAGPRVHVRPVAGLPLLYVEEPTFGGGRRFVKVALDLVLAASMLVVLAPLLLVVAVLVRREDGGPVFYRQERVGRSGDVFRIWKFRTMRVGADQMRADLSNEADGPLFKVRKDPRLTRCGVWLRAYSLDELPQLLNVLSGSMSLVGPRPPLPSEVELYSEHVHRRLLVKPGMSGLWQISGRADLEWDEAVRLDLYYVENWSVTFDLMILWKTVFAVLQRRGAY